MVSKTTLIAALAFATSALAHMEMTYPYPFKSKYNPANGYQNIDYSMTSPLGAYPCKGYIDPSAPSVATWEAGSTVSYTIGGTAVHGGGSCQLAMSYDDGASWNVIYSIIGGCLVEGLTENVKIPSDAPSGEALFAWNWFNLLGNREMYQNCAPVTITNGGKGLDSAKYPAPFVANVDAAPGCHTIEGTEVVFPNPGANVRYGGKYAGMTPEGGKGITGTCSTVTAPQLPSSDPVKEEPTATTSPVAEETLNSPSSSSAAATASSASSSSMAASSSAAAASSVSAAASSSSTIASSFSSAAASSSAIPQSSIGYQHNADPTPSASSAAASPSASSTGTSAPKCKRRSGVSKRHERLVRRAGHGTHERLVRRRVHRDMPATQDSI